MKKKSNNAVIQYLKFIVVGSINAIVNYVAYAAVVFVGGHYVLATLVGFVLSVLSSYLINSRLVLNAMRESRAGRFCSDSMLCMLSQDCFDNLAHMALP